MYRRILVPVSLSAEKTLTERALRNAVHLSLPAEGALHVVNVMPGFGSPWVASQMQDFDLEGVRNDVYTSLEELISQVVPQDVPVKMKVLDGNPHKCIVTEAERVQADLIVIPGQSHHRAQEFFLGSVAARVVERAGVSVLVVR